MFMSIGEELRAGTGHEIMGEGATRAGKAREARARAQRGEERKRRNGRGGGGRRGEGRVTKQQQNHSFRGSGRMGSSESEGRHGWHGILHPRDLSITLGIAQAFSLGSTDCDCMGGRSETKCEDDGGGKRATSRFGAIGIGDFSGAKASPSTALEVGGGGEIGTDCAVVAPRSPSSPLEVLGGFLGIYWP